MKKLLLLFLIPISAFAQNNIRWDLTAQTTTGVGQMVPVLALPGAFINFYTSCTHLPCTTAATTYISASSSSTCPANAQVVWQLPLSQTCSAVADSQGNFGGYFQPGPYQYTITVSGHVNGPYQFNVGTGTTGSGGCSVGGIPTTGGIVNGDVTSTNCGTNNRTSDTATVPANTQTFGYTNLASNNADEVIAVGNNNGTNGNSAESIWIGDTNAGSIPTVSSNTNNIGIGYQNFKNLVTPTGNRHDEDIAIGDSNYQGSGCSICTFIGLENGFNLTFAGSPTSWPTVNIGIGNANITNMVDSDELVAIGDSNFSNFTATGDFVDEAVGIGDGTCTAVSVATSGTGDNWVCLGNASAGNIHPNSVDVVAIGDGAMTQSNGIVTVTSVSDVVAIGDGPAKFNQGNEVVAIGLEPLSPSATMASGGTHNSANELIAIGHLAMAANTTGANNVGIGGFAGADGLSYPNTIGNANKTGSNNTWIGYDASPGTTSQLSNTIAIGYQAHTSSSNSVVIGNSSMTSGLTLYGCTSGQAPFGDGTGCFTPLASPLTTKGDIFVYGSGNTRLPVGTNGQVLSANSAQTTGLQWISALTNPMTTLGDIIYGGAAGAATRLAGPTAASTVCLTSTGTGSAAQAPVWGACSGSAATALSSISAASTNATINSSNNPIVWNWAQTSNSQSAFTFGENTAASGTGDVELTVSTAAGSTAIPLSITNSLNGAQTLSTLSVTPTWNTSGVVDAAILVNATNTASGAASKLFDLQVGGTSKFAVDKAGIVTNGTWQGVAIANAFLANSAVTVNGSSISLGGSGTVTANTTNSLTMNNGGAGAGSGTTFNGNSAVTLSYNTLGAAPAASPTFTGTVTLPLTGSTQCVQVNSSGTVGGTGTPCGSGGGGGFAGTVTYTTSHTLSATGSQCAVGGNDNGCLIIMNCSSACSLTLPNPQPTSTMLVGVISRGSSIATIALGSSMTYNNNTVPPVLLSNSQISVASNSSVSTDYVGTTPIKAGAGVTITSSTANQTVIAAGSTSTVGSAEVVAFSATPTFSAAVNVSRIVLSGNITSFTLAGAGTDGQLKTLCFEQGAGPYTVANPANVHGFFTIGTISTDWNCQPFVWDNTDSIWLASGPGVINQ